MTALRFEAGKTPGNDDVPRAAAPDPLRALTAAAADAGAASVMRPSTAAAPASRCTSHRRHPRVPTIARLLCAVGLEAASGPRAGRRGSILGRCAPESKVCVHSGWCGA